MFCHPVKSLYVFITIFSIIVFSCPITAQDKPAGLTAPAGAYKIPFRWEESVRGNYKETQAALLLPVTLPGCPHTFYMQFDLGAPASLLYGNKLAAIAARYPAAIPSGDSSFRNNVTLRVGKMPVTASRLAVRSFESGGINWKGKEPKIIGTLGADLITGKVLLADYPGGTLSLLDSVPGELSSLTLQPFHFVQGRVLLPSVLRGKATLLYFDTGSSAYELLTDKEGWASLRKPGAADDAHTVNSWGRQWTAHTVASADSIMLGGAQLPLRRVTYMEGPSETTIAQMKQAGIGGMTGNSLFTRNRLLIDTKNSRFAVLEPVKPKAESRKQAGKKRNNEPRFLYNPGLSQGCCLGFHVYRFLLSGRNMISFFFGRFDGKSA